MSSRRASLGQRADGLLSVAANRTAQTLTGKTEREVTRLPIAKIRRDGGTQPRAGLDQAVVEEYAEVIRDGGALPAVEVVHDGTDYWLWDGYHRLAAAEQEGETEYDCIVTPGTRRDAVLKSVGANADHGLRRTDDDKRRAVEVLLADPEWSQWSNREIARQCKVGHPLVAKIREEMTGSGFQSGKKNTEKRVGADGREYKVSNIQAANQRRAEEQREVREREAAIADLRVRILERLAGGPLRSIELAAMLGEPPLPLYRQAREGLKADGLIVEEVAPGMRVSYRLAEPKPAPAQNGSDWLDTPASKGAPPQMAVAANGAPAHSDDHDPALDAAYRAEAQLSGALLKLTDAADALLAIQGIRALYALPEARIRALSEALYLLSQMADDLKDYAETQLEKLRVMVRTGRPYDEDGEA